MAKENANIIIDDVNKIYETLIENIADNSLSELTPIQAKHLVTYINALEINARIRTRKEKKVVLSYPIDKFKQEIEKSLKDGNNTYSSFMESLIRYLLDKGDDELIDFLEQLDDGYGNIDWNTLYLWSQNTLSYEIELTNWVRDSEDFILWKQKQEPISINIPRVEKVTKYSKRSIVTLDALIAVLQEIKDRRGGDKEIQVLGCYASTGEIEAIKEYPEDNWYNGYLIVSDIC